jgi:hypothetical protein
MRSSHDPACLGRRGLWLGPHPQQQGGDTRGLRRERQLAAGDQIELPRRAPDLQHHNTHCIAGERIRGGPQRAVYIGGAHAHEKTRIETKFG